MATENHSLTTHQINIDFTPLVTANTREAVKEYLRDVFQFGIFSVLFALAGIAFFAAFTGFGIALMLEAEASSKTGGAIIVLLFGGLLFLIVGGVVVSVAARISAGKWRSFISRNNLREAGELTELHVPYGIVQSHTIPRGLLQDASSGSAKAFLMEMSQNTFLTDGGLIAGTFNGQTLEFYRGRYVAASTWRRSRQSPYLYIFRMRLPFKAPHVMVDAHDSKYSLRVPKHYEKYELEGNFPSKFSVWFDPRYRLEALSILTPDVMYAIQQFGAGYDLETYENYLYAYTAISREEDLKHALNSLFFVASEAQHQSKHMKDTESLLPLYKVDISYGLSYLQLIRGLRAVSASLLIIVGAPVLAIVVAIVILVVHAASS